MTYSNDKALSPASADAARLECLLRARLAGRVNDLNLVAQPQGLILRGHTRTYYAKQLAQHAVMQESRLPIFANEIEVR